jgi:Protein of unknown function (DUF4239)
MQNCPARYRFMREMTEPQQWRWGNVMNPMAISWIAFVCVFGGALIGIFLGYALPEHHLSADSKNVLNLVMGLIGTMSALVLGLLIATAQSSFSTRNAEFTQMSANIILLDRVLARYGSETKDARALLRQATARELQLISPENDALTRVALDPRANRADALYDMIQDLSPKNDMQKALQAQAMTMTIDLGQTRWLLFEQSGASIPSVFLVVLVFWLSVIFAGFGLFAPRNTTVIIAFVVGALSVSGAIFLILEMDQPFQGMIHISGLPLRNALMILGQ